MVFSHGLVASLSRDISLKITIAVLCLIQTCAADLCSRIANCSCDSPSNLLCSGNDFISVDLIVSLVPAGFILFLDVRGRIFSTSFIPELAAVLPRLEVLRLEGCDCSNIVQYLGQFNFTILHTCHHYLTTEDTLSSSQTPSSETDTPSLPPTLSTLPYSDSSPASSATTDSNVTSSSYPAQIVTHTEDRTGIILAVTFAVLAVIVFIYCYVRLSRGQPILCFSCQNSQDVTRDEQEDRRGQSRAEQSGDSATSYGSSGHQLVSAESEDVLSTTRQDLDSSQTKVMRLYSPEEPSTSDVIVQVSMDSPNPLPATSTPERGGRSASLAACFAPSGSPPYLPISPASTSDISAMSSYHTPDGNLSSVPLVVPKKKTRGKKKSASWWERLVGKRRNLRNDSAKEVLPDGLPPKTRNSQDQARLSSKDKVELSASITGPSVESENMVTCKVSSV